MLKAISLLQPWASLVVAGHKRIETRSWNTLHRGNLLIHASANRKKGKPFAGQQYFRDCLPQKDGNALDAAAIDWEGLPFGAIIGKVQLVATARTQMIAIGDEIKIGDDGEYDYIHLTRQEKAFGDYSANRYAWLLSDPELLDEPVPCKGSLNLWTPDVETMKQVSAIYYYS